MIDREHWMDGLPRGGWVTVVGPESVTHRRMVALVEEKDMGAPWTSPYVVDAEARIPPSVAARQQSTVGIPLPEAKVWYSVMSAQIDMAVAAERERCARVAEAYATSLNSCADLGIAKIARRLIRLQDGARRIADEIREGTK